MEENEHGEHASRAPNLDDIALLVGIRREEGDALREFVHRFQPLLLDQARRLGIQRSERETVVMGFLDDVLLKLAHMQAPRSLPTFVVTSFRNATVEAWQADVSRDRRDTNECELIGDARVVSACGERDMLGVCATRGAGAGCWRHTDSGTRGRVDERDHAWVYTGRAKPTGLE